MIVGFRFIYNIVGGRGRGRPRKKFDLKEFDLPDLREPITCTSTSKQITENEMAMGMAIPRHNTMTYRGVVISSIRSRSRSRW